MAYSVIMYSAVSPIVSVICDATGKNVGKWLQKNGSTLEGCLLSI
jgi:hypothetical protein